jgi:AraC-like DNA-binding protein
MAKRTSRRPLDPDRTPRPVFVLAERYAALDGEWHTHRRGQLIHASVGVLTVRTALGLWVVPPERAVWVPPGIAHRVSSKKSFWLTTLYVEPALAPLPPMCRVVSVDRLASELLLAAAALGPDYPLGGPEERLVQVLLDRLPTLEVNPMHLPRPSDARLRAIVKSLEADPADPRTLEALCRSARVTPRTAARLFKKETGRSFGRWRQQLRLLSALERLGAGQSVTEVAFDVGYQDVSSFIAMFKSALGQTPARYFGGSAPSQFGRDRAHA